eukprot:4412994-Pyramimonas_sp.AAC.1
MDTNRRGRDHILTCAGLNMRAQMLINLRGARKFSPPRGGKRHAWRSWYNGDREPSSTSAQS